MNSSCGAYGECIDNECQCFEGFVQTFDFKFRQTKEDGQNETILRQTLPCDVHLTTSRSLYALAAVMAFINVSVYLFFNRRKWSYLRRISFYVLGFLILTVVSAARAISTDPTKVVSVDLTVGLLFFGGLGLVITSQIVFLFKYVSYARKNLPLFLSKKANFRRVFIQILLVAGIISVVVGTFLLCVAVVLTDHIERDLLFRVGLGCYAFCFFTVIPLALLSINNLLSDIKENMKVNEKNFLKKAANDLRKIQFLFIVYSLLSGAYFFICAVFPFEYRGILSMITPVVLIAGNVLGLLTLYFLQKPRKRKQLENSKSRENILKRNNTVTSLIQSPTEGI